MGDRTPDLLNAIQALYQLSYRPNGSPELDSNICPTGTAKDTLGYVGCQEFFTGKGLDSGSSTGILHRAHLTLGEIISNPSECRTSALRYYI
jgi:hypothetical protein